MKSQTYEIFFRFFSVEVFDKTGVIQSVLINSACVILIHKESCCELQFFHFAFLKVFEVGSQGHNVETGVDNFRKVRHEEVSPFFILTKQDDLVDFWLILQIFVSLVIQGRCANNFDINIVIKIFQVVLEALNRCKTLDLEVLLE